MKKDEFHVHEVSERALFGVRRTDEGETKGVIMPMVEGRNLNPGMEVVHTKSRPGENSVLDLESVIKIKGPPAVSTTKYRKNYDQIFGKDNAKSTCIN